MSGILLNMKDTMLVSDVIKSHFVLKSGYLKREVELEVFLPPGLLGNERLNLLILNDGQEALGLKLEDTLNTLYAKDKTGPIAAVAIKASQERIQEYGVAGVPDFLGRGSLATAYTNFIIEELLPYLEKKIPYSINGTRAFVGFSLGGLSAFDIAWNNSSNFDVVGVLSGAFWWRKKDLKDGYTDADRILHDSISRTPEKPNLKFWLMTGTEDEQADRNKNYIIDSIDDTIDIIKELLRKGYKRPNDICYYEMVGGEHNVATWAKALPSFLIWAFSSKLN
ncbi:enterochelin esterase-like enzyme [Pedobacter sp. UYP24]